MPSPAEEDELIAVRLLGPLPKLVLSGCPESRTMGKLCGPLEGGSGSPVLAGKLLGASPGGCTVRVRAPEPGVRLLMADSAVASMLWVNWELPETGTLSKPEKLNPANDTDVYSYISTLINITHYVHVSIYIYSFQFNTQAKFIVLS